MERRTQRNHNRPSRKGAVFVEFALGFLVFIMLVFGVFEGARLIWTYSTLAHSAREGVRYAMVHGHQSPVQDSAVETWVEQRAIGLTPADVTVATTWADTTKAGSSVVEVRVSYPITLLAAPLVFGQSSMNLSYSARGTIAE